MSATAIAAHEFAAARRGYDQEEVRSFLAAVAGHLRDQEDELRRRAALVDLLERKAASAQEAAYARVFRQMMEVVRTAEREAARIREQASQEARSILANAREEAALVQVLAPAEAGPRSKGPAEARVGAGGSDIDDFSIDVELLWGKGAGDS